ncbi:MAG: hypothetical protein ACYTAF_07130 [Planctomycetota bacterium]|jgi:hypothetical protein
MLFLFQRELGLTGSQRRHFGEVLAERDGAFEEIRNEVWETKIYNEAVHRPRIEEIRHRYFEKMGLCLDSRQYARFQELLAEQEFGDGVVIPMPEDVTIID